MFIGMCQIRRCHSHQIVQRLHRSVHANIAGQFLLHVDLCRQSLILILQFLDGQRLLLQLIADLGDGLLCVIIDIRLDCREHEKIGDPRTDQQADGNVQKSAPSGTLLFSH